MPTAACSSTTGGRRCALAARPCDCTLSILYLPGYRAHMTIRAVAGCLRRPAAACLYIGDYDAADGPAGLDGSGWSRRHHPMKYSLGTCWLLGGVQKGVGTGPQWRQRHLGAIVHLQGANMHGHMAPVGSTNRDPLLVRWRRNIQGQVQRAPGATNSEWHPVLPPESPDALHAWYFAPVAASKSTRRSPGAFMPKALCQPDSLQSGEIC